MATSRLRTLFPVLLLVLWTELGIINADIQLQNGDDGISEIVDGHIQNPATTIKTAEKFIETHSHHRLSSNFMLSLYQNLSRGLSLNEATGRPNHVRNLKFADTVRTFTAIGNYDNNYLHLYKFNLSQVGQHEVLRGAELHFWLPTEWLHQQELYIVSVASGSVGNGLTYASSIPIVTPAFSAEGIAIVDVTLPVKDWLKGFVADDYHRRGKHSMDLAVVPAFGRRKGFSRSKLLRHLERIYENDEAVEQQTPEVILVTYSEAGGDFLNTTASKLNNRISRLKRTIAATSNNSLEQQQSNDASACRRKDMKVDFPALGWGEWVVYPTLFNAFQCTGRCGGFTDSRHNPTNHAIVQGLVRLVSRRDIPISCCTPTKLSPLSILYLEKGSVVIKHHEDMIVEECGCM